MVSLFVSCVGGLMVSISMIVFTVDTILILEGESRGMLGMLDVSSNYTKLGRQLRSLKD